MSSLGSEWHISSTGSDIITENGTIRDTRKIFESALNYDLKEICSPVLANELSKEIVSKTVLQIQKIRNISAPKANEDSQAAPRMLKLSLTDGDTFIQAVELSPINSISRNLIPPGSKVLINKAKIVSGYLLLTGSNCTLLGGRVPHLVEKWELAKSINRHHARNNSSEDGPPPWVSFGKRVQTENPQQNFNSLGKSKESKENSEFELQRQGAIAEATSGATPKVFGGRVKQNIQAATGATTASNKTIDRKDQGKIRHRNQPKEEEEKPLKPSDKVSLFSFLEDKLPVSEPSKSVGGTHNSNSSYRSKESNKFNNQRIAMHSQTDLGNNEKFQHFKTENWGNKSYNNINNTSNIQAKNNVQLNKLYATNKMSRENESKEYEESYRNNRNESYRRNGISNEYSKSYNHSNSISKSVNTAERVNSYEIDNPPNYLRRDNRLSGNKKQSDKSDNKNNNTSQNHQSNQQYDKPEFNNYNKDDKQTSSGKTESKHQPHWKPNYNSVATKTDSSVSIDKEETVSNIHIGNANMNSSHDRNAVAEQNLNVGKVSMNSQFVSRSLRQHLNLGSGKKSEDVKETDFSNKELNEERLWQVGDEILAKYWEDGKFYNATVTAVTDKTYAVKFKGYGNIEEIFKHDCLPIQNNTNRPNNNYRQNRQYGSVEFRRSNRNYK